MITRPPLPPAIPTASGRNPWATDLCGAPPAPPVDIPSLARGAGLLTQSPAYRAANLPPFKL